MSKPGCLRILVVISAPVWDELTNEEPSRLDIGKEWKTIIQDIKKKPFPVRIDRLPIATDEKLMEALADAKGEGAPYSVVHISGHGMKGYLAFDDGHGCVHRIDARILGDTFHNQGVKLVVLSTCHSAGAAAGDLSVADSLVQAGVPTVIGMAQMIIDDVATKLTAILYHRLATGLAVNEALEAARMAIRHDPAFQKDEGGYNLADDADIPVVKGKQDLTLDLVATEPGIFDNYPPNNLPRNAYFFGRAQELVRISHELAESHTRIVAISGIGGIGKSSLAHEAALRYSYRFDGIICAEATQDTTLTINSIYDEVRKILRLGVDSDIPEVLNNVFCLLILDNLHWLSDKDWIPIADFIRKLDPIYSKVIVTYRAPWKHPFFISGYKELSLDDLDQNNSVNLLQTGKPAPWFSRNETDDKEIERLNLLAKVCRHHPYFLQLAAARLNLQPFEQLYEEVKEFKGEFQKESDRFLESQVALLDLESKKLFPQLSIFPASFDRDAAATIYINGINVDDALLNLAKLRLLIYSPDDSRYHLHDLTRAYAKKILSKEEFTTLSKKHAQYFLEQAHFARQILNTEKAEIGAVLAERERLNWLAGVRFFETQKDQRKVVAYGFAVDDPLERAGYWIERKIILEQAIDAAQQLDDKESMSMLKHNLGLAYYQQGNYKAAKKCYQNSLELKKILGNKAGISTSLHQLGLLAHAQGEYETARKYYEESLQIKKEIEDEAGISTTLHQLGILSQTQGDYQAAKNYYEDSLDIVKRLEDWAGISASLHQLGMLAQAQGQYDTARQYYQKSLKLLHAHGDRARITFSLHQLGMLAQSQGQYDIARQYYQENLKLLHALGDKAGISKSLHQLGRLAQIQADYQTARKYYEESLRIKKTIGDKAGISTSFHQLGMLAQAQADNQTARKYYENSLEIDKKLGDKVGIAISFFQIALLEEEEGNTVKALELISKAEDLLVQLHHPYAVLVRKDRERLERKKG